MRSRRFDRSLWLFVALSAVIFYLEPFGSGGAMFIAFAVVCAVCGYAAGTRAALAFVAPLNLLLAPAFFVGEAPEVVVVMVAFSLIAAPCLLAGSLLHRRGRAAAESPAGDGFRQAIGGASLVRISAVMVSVLLVLVVVAQAAGFELRNLRLAVDEATHEQLPVDGRSNLTGGAASLAYTPGPDLRELVTDEDWGAGPNDGARWELRSKFSQGENFVSLAHYVFDDPRLDNPAAIADFVAGKDDEHSDIAGHRVKHTERVVDGRTGYVWTHDNFRGYWHHATWFPHPIHTIRLECVARDEIERFKRLCKEATESLKFH